MSAIRLDAHGPEFLRKMPPQLPVRVATTTVIAISTALNSGDTIDGVTLATGDRVLVKDQSTASQNGIYEVGAAPERSFDFREGLAAYGALVIVVSGTVNGGKAFRCTNTSVPTIDTTDITFEEFAPAFALDSHALQTITASGASVDLDCDVASTFDITLTDDCTITISNPPPSGVDARITVILRQGTGAPWTVTWPGSVVWQDATDGGDDGTAPTLWTDLDAVNVIELATLDGGTSWGGTPLGADGGGPTGAAGGDLSGTYPNPSVVDDSHNHTAATAPGSGGGGHYEVVVSGTAPPVAVTNVAEDDWVYGFVPD